MKLIKLLFISTAVLFCNPKFANSQWVPINGPGLSGGASCFAVSGTNIFAGTSNGFFDGVFRSSDDGASWTRAGLSNAFINSLMARGMNLFAGTSHGLFITTNQGVDWEAVNSGLTDTNVTALAQIGTILFAGTSTAGVFRSTDNGSSWSAGGLKKASILFLTPNGTNLFAGTYQGGVSLSTDNGVNWATKSSGLPLNSTVNAFAINGTELFAGTDSEGVFLSTDNGGSWIGVNNGLTNKSLRVLMVNASDIYAGTDSGKIFRSTNNGTIWTEIDHGLMLSSYTTTVHALAMKGTILFAGVNAGIFLSHDKGTNWQEVNHGLTFPYATVYALAGNETRIVGGTKSRGINFSTDKGTSWTGVSTFLGGDYISALALNGMNLFIGTNAGIFLQSDNGGTAEITPIRYVPAWALAASGSTLFAATGSAPGNGSSTIIWRTTNDGTSWGKVNSNFADPNVFAIATIGADLFIGTSRGVFYSTDNGGTWSAINNGLPDLNISALAVDGTNLFAGTVNSGIFLSTNNGINWIAVKSGMMNNQIYALSVSGVDLIAAAKDGLWRRPLSEMISSTVSPESGPSHFSLDQNFPNPFNPSTTISYTLTDRSMVLLEVFDMLGQRIQTLVNRSMDAGPHSVRFDAGNLSNGIYTARLTANNLHRGIKMVLGK